MNVTYIYYCIQVYYRVEEEAEVKESKIDEPTIKSVAKLQNKQIQDEDSYDTVTN